MAKIDPRALETLRKNKQKNSVRSRLPKKPRPKTTVAPTSEEDKSNSENLPQEIPTPASKDEPGLGATSENTPSPPQLGITPKHKQEIANLYKHFGYEIPDYTNADPNVPSKFYDDQIKTLKEARTQQNNAGLDYLQKQGITKHHLLEKGIKKFKFEANTNKSRIEGNTLILGKEHYDQPLNSLHKLLNSNKDSHASSKALARSNEMRTKALEEKAARKPYGIYRDAALRWHNMARLLKKDPEKGLAIVKELKDLSEKRQKPSRERLDFLLNLYGTKQKPKPPESIN